MKQWGLSEVLAFLRVYNLGQYEAVGVCVWVFVCDCLITLCLCRYSSKRELLVPRLLFWTRQTLSIWYVVCVLLLLLPVQPLTLHLQGMSKLHARTLKRLCATHSSWFTSL